MQALARALELVEDLRFQQVDRWKESHPGGLVVGYLPIYVPRALFEAMGCLPVELFGGGDQLDVVRGDSFFQSYICHIPRSTVELAVNGSLHAFDAFVFPSTCDVIRNLGGMWRMLMPSSAVAYLDLPQNFAPELGGRFYVEEMKRIAELLVARGAKPLTDAGLREAIARENERRALLEELSVLRRKEPWRVRASEAYVAARAGTLLPADEHSALLREVLKELRAREAKAYDNVRVVVRGAFCEQPPIALLRTLEQAGCDIVADDFMLGLYGLKGAIALEPGVDPLESMAKTFVLHGEPTACRYVGEAPKGDALVADVRRCGADGVVFLAASFCDPALLDQPMLEKALDEARIPHTSVKYAENNGQFQAVREQAGAFSDALKLWGAA